MFVMRRWAPWIALVAAVVLLVAYSSGRRRSPSPPRRGDRVERPTARDPPRLPDTARGSRRGAPRPRRDARPILETLKKRGEPIRPDPQPKQAAAPPPKKEGDETRGKYNPDYIRATFREDMFPILRSCYEGALKRRPDLAGKLVLSFTIVGDHDVGGVIEDADVEDDSTLKDDDMETCVKESLMTLTFDKPPSGGGYVTVRYPVAFTPGDKPPPDDAGG